MLTDEQKKKVSDLARSKGVSESDALSAAEKLIAGGDGSIEPAQEESALAAERFLIGFLPYITVREFRTLVLGISGDVVDSDKFTGEWLDIHGSQSAEPSQIDKTGEE